jgi:hypothetical protein
MIPFQLVLPPAAPTQRVPDRDPEATPVLPSRSGRTARFRRDCDDCDQGSVGYTRGVRQLLAVLGLLVFAAAATAAPARANNNFVYSGTLDGSTTAAGSGDKTSAHVSWSEIGSSPRSSPTTVTWSLATLSGAVSFSGDPSSNTPACTGTLSAAPNPNKVFAPGIDPVTGGYEVLTYNPAEVGSPGPINYQVQSTAPYGSVCGAQYGPVVQMESCARNDIGTKLDAALRPDAVFPGGSSVKHFDVPAIGGPCASAQFTFSISSSIQFTGDPVSGTPPPPPPPPPPGGPHNVPPSPTKAQQKLIALDDIVKTLPRTSAECLDSGRGFLAAAFSGGRFTPEAAALLIPTADTLCAVDLRNLLHDWIVVNDPPDSHFRTVAAPAKATLHGVRLPACRGHGRARRFCGTLRPKLLSLILAARTVESINAAMETTINRIAGAQKAHNAAGVRRQGAAAVRLRARMRRAVAARDALGVTVAKEIRAAGVGVKLNRTQDSTGLGFVLKSLAKHRVKISIFTARVGAAATPIPADLLALL